MIAIGEKNGGGRGLRRRGIAVWSGVFPSPVGVVFFAIREIFSQFKGGAWPKWPNGKYATGHMHAPVV